MRQTDPAEPLLNNIFEKFVPLFAGVFALLVGFIFAFKLEDSKNITDVQNAYRTLFNLYSESSDCFNGYDSSDLLSEKQVKSNKKYNIKTWNGQQSRSKDDLEIAWASASTRSPALSELLRLFDQKQSLTEDQWNLLICTISLSPPFAFGVRTAPDGANFYQTKYPQLPTQTGSTDSLILTWSRVIQDISQDLELRSMNLDKRFSLRLFAGFVDSKANYAKEFERVSEIQQSTDNLRTRRIFWPSFLLGLVGIFGFLLPTSLNLWTLHNPVAAGRWKTLYILFCGWLPLFCLVVTAALMLWL